MITSDETKVSFDALCCLYLHLKNIVFLPKYHNIMEMRNWSITQLAQSLFPQLQRQEIITELKQKIKDYSKSNVILITILDPHFPQKLKDINDCPFVIFAKGNINLLKQKNISIVGTRNPSKISIHACDYFSTQLALNNYTTISGMAKGIDSVAHRASLHYGGNTIGVIAHGHNHVYPKENFDLFKLANCNESVLLISEYEPNITPRRYFFPRRNRIIAALSQTLVFFEGSIKSGAISSCNIAINQNKNIYIFDHKYSSNNEGGKKMLFDGAPNLDEILATKTFFCDTKKPYLSSKKYYYLGQNQWVSFNLKAQPSNLL